MSRLIILLLTLLLVQISAYSQISPEIVVLSGYYDWQTNGACPHYIQYSSPFLQAIYLTSSDSTQINITKRTKFAVSTDGGINWEDMGDVVPARSSYPTMTLTVQGSALIGLNCMSQSFETTGIMRDLAAGIGSFAQTYWTGTGTNFAWPFVTTMSNGKIFIAAGTLQNGLSTDTGIGVVYDSYSDIWQTPKKFVTDATTQSNMRWTCAAGPGGRVLYVLDPINDNGGSYGGNRIFYYISTDNGLTWSSQNMLFNSFIDPDGDTVKASRGLDAVYDESGNFYVAYNTIADSLQTAKLWISKNGNPGVLAVSNLDIPGSLKSMTKPMEGVISIDWPSIGMYTNNYIFVVYSVFKQDDTVNGFQSADIYCSISPTNNLNFETFQLTSGTADERYPSLYKKIELYDARIVYQKDPQPGSAVFDGAPVSRASLIYRHFFIISGIKKTGSEIPLNFDLSQNYPNPFNPATTIKFNVAKTSKVQITIFDVSGRKVETIVDEMLQPGVYEQTWNAQPYASGVYFYRLTTDDFTECKKMIFVK